MPSENWDRIVDSLQGEATQFDAEIGDAVIAHERTILENNPTQRRARRFLEILRATGALLEAQGESSVTVLEIYARTRALIDEHAGYRGLTTGALEFPGKRSIAPTTRRARELTQMQEPPAAQKSRSLSVQRFMSETRDGFGDLDIDCLAAEAPELDAWFASQYN